MDKIYMFVECTSGKKCCAGNAMIGTAEQIFKKVGGQVSFDSKTNLWTTVFGQTGVFVTKNDKGVSAKMDIMTVSAMMLEGIHAEPPVQENSTKKLPHKGVIKAGNYTFKNKP